MKVKGKCGTATIYRLAFLLVTLLHLPLVFFFPMFSLVIYVHFNDGLTPMLHRHLTYKLGLVGVVEEVI